MRSSVFFISLRESHNFVHLLTHQLPALNIFLSWQLDTPCPLSVSKPSSDTLQRYLRAILSLPKHLSSIHCPPKENQETYSVSLTFLPSALLLLTSALITNAASLCVNASTFWNSPSFNSAAASSSPWGASRVRDVGAGVAIFVARQFVNRELELLGGGS